MKILVLTKYSLDVAEVRVIPETGELRMSGVPRRFGELDKGAVEAAVRLKESQGGSVEVLCLGPPAARTAMRDVLAIGADEATVVDDPYDGAADAAVAVAILEAAVARRGPFDLVVCGFASDDGYSHQTGARLAERLGVPFVSYACALRLEEGRLVADRDLEDGLQTVSLPLPAVVSVAEEAFAPRAVTLLQVMKAQKLTTNAWELADLGMERRTLDELATCTVTDEVGVMVRRGREMLPGGTPDQLADELIDRLVAHGVLTLEVGS